MVKSRRWLLIVSTTTIVLLTFVAAIAAMFARRWGPPAEAPFTISEQTTNITGPAREDGTIDYVAALNQHCSEGVTQENNAFVLMTQVLNPQHAYVPELKTAYFAALKVDPPPNGTQFFTLFSVFIEENEAAGDPNSSQSRQALPDAVFKPWQSNGYPVVAAWLDHNRKPLETITQASLRPYWYIPMLVDSSTDPPPMLNVILPGFGAMRQAALAILVRASNHAGEGDYQTALADLRAAGRLARHIASGSSVVEVLVGNSIRSRCFDVVRETALDQATPQAFRKRLLESDPHAKSVGSLIDAIDIFERWTALDAVQSKAMGEPVALSSEDEASEIRRWRRHIDWDETLREINWYYDQLIDSLAIADYAKWSDERERFDGVYDNILRHRAPGREYLPTDRSPESRKLVGRYFAHQVLNCVEPALHHAELNQRKTREFGKLTRISIALAMYRHDHGGFPEQLKPLKPNYLDEIPTDYFASGQPLKYRTTAEADGFLLYSLGENAQDDAGDGSGREEPDLVVRYNWPVSPQVE